jgi:3,4-dihydroxy 2-butanone 4-phosphate synthase/GTP cyclohydrolase II
MIIRLGERELATKFGTYKEVLYYDGQRESIAIVMGDVADGEKVLCRIHSNCISAHVFNSVECDCREQMEASQLLIEKEGRGVIIWLDQEGKGNGHLALIQSAPFKRAGNSQAIAYQKAGFQADPRSYGAAASILNDLKIRTIVLLVNGSGKVEGLKKESIVVAGTIKLSG